MGRVICQYPIFEKEPVQNLGKLSKGIQHEGTKTRRREEKLVSVQQPEDVEANQAEAEAKAEENHKNLLLERYALPKSRLDYILRR